MKHSKSKTEWKMKQLENGTFWIMNHFKKQNFLKNETFLKMKQRGKRNV